PSGAMRHGVEVKHVRTPSSSAVASPGSSAPRCLSGHFQHVTLVERDLLSDGAAQRRGVSQGAHLHVLLTRGGREFGALFPEEIVSAGTQPMDVADELALLMPAGWKPRFRSGITILPCSRQLLERLNRR